MFQIIFFFRKFGRLNFTNRENETKEKNRIDIPRKKYTNKHSTHKNMKSVHTKKQSSQYKKKMEKPMLQKIKET